MRTEAINTALARRRGEPPPAEWKERLTTLAASGELLRRGLVAGPLLAVGFAVAAFGGVYGWAYGTAYLLVYACVAIWLVQVWRGRLPLRWHWIQAAVAAIAVATGLRLLPGLTLVRGDTLTAAMQLVPAALLFLMLSQVTRPEQDVAWIAPCLAVFTAAVSLLALAQLLTSSNAIYWHFRYTYASPAGPYVNRNHFAGCMELLLPVALLQAYRHHSRPLAFLGWSLPPVLGLGALLLSASRGGAVSMTVECVAGLGLLFLVRQREPRSAPTVTALAKRSAGAAAGRRIRGAQYDKLWFALAAGFTLCVAMSALVGTQRLQNRFARFTLSPTQSANLTGDSLNPEKRDLLNQASAAMWRVHPVFGWGLGTWASIYPHYAFFDDGLVYEFAHNDYWQWLTETGLAGGGLLAVFWLFWGVTVAGELRRPGAGRGLVAAALLACLGLLVHSWVDFNLHIPANLMLFLTMAAWGVSGNVSSRPTESVTPDLG